LRLLVGIARWDLIGGSERYAGAAVRGLAARGHELVVLCAGGRQEAPAERVVLPELGQHGLDRAARERLRAALRAFEPDVILLLNCPNPDALELLLDQAPVVRFVQDHTLFCPGLNKLHAGGGPCTTPLGGGCITRYFLGGGCAGYRTRGRLPSVRFALRRLRQRLRDIDLHRRAARLIVSSAYMRGELLAAGFAAGAIDVLPYFTLSATAAIPSGPLPGQTRAFVEADGRPLLFTPARLALPDKGVDHLLAALGRIDGRRFKAVVAGDGPAREWLERKARDEGLAPAVHFAGWLEPGAIETLYAHSRALVLPSVWDEPFGLVGLEAMAHGKPAVAFDVGGVREWLVPGHTGLTAPRADSEALARAIVRLLDSPSLARRLGHAGRARLARHFSPALHLERLERCLSSARRPATLAGPARRA